MPEVEPPLAGRKAGTIISENGPPFARLITLQPRFGGMPFQGAEQPIETGGWLGLAEPRPIDPLSLAFFADALIPVPFFGLQQPNPAPTIDLTVHFRGGLPPLAERDPEELCLARVRVGWSTKASSRRTPSCGLPTGASSPTRASSPCCCRCRCPASEGRTPALSGRSSFWRSG